jgi:anaerobic magnesium-protoporphyrin IX monomethyl ester cyclase
MVTTLLIQSAPSPLRVADYNKPTIPLGLAYIAAVLEQAGHEVTVIDNYAERNHHRQITERVSRIAPDVVGISTDSFSFQNAIEIAKAVKEANKDILVVAGGPHPSVWPDAPLKFPEFDISVHGEGETTAIELWHNLETGKPMRHVKGIAYRQDGSVIINPRRDLITNLDRLPFPARHLFPLKRYERREIYLRARPADTMSTSRGCPYACRFCSSKAVFGRTYRYRSPTNVVAEIEVLVRDYGTRGMYIREDIFTANRKRVLETCDLMLERGLDISWACESRVDTVDEKMLRVMKNAGCQIIWFGIESGSQEVLDYLGKGITKHQIQKTLDACRRVGIQAGASFVIGIPGETIEQMHETIDFACRLMPLFAWFNIYLGIPTSALYEYAKQNGYVDEYVENGIFTIKTGEFDRKTLEKMRDYANARFRGYWKNLAYRVFTRTHSLISELR